MKLTKSMIYTPTAESNNLYLIATNTEFIYKGTILPVIKNLRKKAERGILDEEKAVIAFYHVADYTSKKVKDLFNIPPFTVTERYTAAVDLFNYYREDIEEK